MGKLNKLLRSWRVITLIVFLALMILAIHPSFFTEGVSIKAVQRGSAAASQFEVSPVASPVSRERIIALNNIPIKSVEEYYAFEDGLQINQTVQVKTNKKTYLIKVGELFSTVDLNETEIVEFNETINDSIVVSSKIVNKTEAVSSGIQPLGFVVEPVPKSNIRKGLDLQVGTRVILQPAKPVSQDVLETIVSNLEQRLNVFGLSDVSVRAVSEPGIFSESKSYVLVELAGKSQEEAVELLSKQGKFEAKIAGENIFVGEDITYVCKTAGCSGLSTQQGCGRVSDGSFNCRYFFEVSLKPEAAKRQASATGKLSVINEGGDDYLSEDLLLYLDDVEVSSLKIGASLRGSTETTFSIQGSGTGESMRDAELDAKRSMKELQGFIESGSLPVKLDIIKTDRISPVLGEVFLKNAFFIGIISIIGVVLVVIIVYRRILLSIPIVITSISEIISILGISAFFGSNLDLSAIAGIIIAVGTSVDHQIVIADESLKRKSSGRSWDDNIKRAFFIIFAAYFTTIVSLTPLIFAGAGLLKGFAFTTIIGVSIGVFITRPAFAAILKIIYE